MRLASRGAWSGVQCVSVLGTASGMELDYVVIAALLVGAFAGGWLARSGSIAGREDDRSLLVRRSAEAVDRAFAAAERFIATLADGRRAGRRAAAARELSDALASAREVAGELGEQLGPSPLAQDLGIVVDALGLVLDELGPCIGGAPLDPARRRRVNALVEAAASAAVRYGRAARAAVLVSAAPAGRRAADAAAGGPARVGDERGLASWPKRPRAHTRRFRPVPAPAPAGAAIDGYAAPAGAAIDGYAAPAAESSRSRPSAREITGR